MDAAQLREQIRKFTEQIAKDEHELMQLEVKVSNLKRDIPADKKKLENFKRDMLATEALAKRRKEATDLYRAQKEGK